MEFFQMTGKNTIPVHKKESKQIISNYSVPLLPICSKIFEKQIFDSIYEFIDKKQPIRIQT